tara:strand:+ start:602 stop:1285 length:684 start_codon:yes stop_codon:yes gene_type:complete
MDISRGFKGIWIPRDLWISKDLSIQDKVFLAEIHSLDNDEGCIASNKYFANFFGLSKSSVSRIVSTLKKKGYVSVRLIKNSDTKEVEKRIIKVVKYGDAQQDIKDSAPKVSFDNIDESIKSANEMHSSLVIDELNRITNRSFRKTASNKRFIIGRINEGYTYSDLINVVKVKAAQWDKNPKMAMYLRPETLFNATKFPSYLEEYKMSLNVKSTTDDFLNTQANFYKI